MFIYSYFKLGNGLAISHHVVGLYTLAVNASSIQLNSFARHALSQLTTILNPELYEAFLDAWGTHIITKSLVGGMVEERAVVTRCFRAVNDDVFARCIPFRDRTPVSSNCAYYAEQTRVISKRRIGGNIEFDNNKKWI